MILSHHAEVRCQQRAIPRQVLEWLFEHGHRIHGPGGAKILHFNKRSVRKLEHSCGKAVVDKYARNLDAYCVVGEDGVVVTAGRRYQRLRH
jgi:hypothetical protein